MASRCDATEPVEFPHHQHIAGSNELKRPRQAGTVILRARGTILKQVTRIDAGAAARRAVLWRSESDDTRM